MWREMSKNMKARQLNPAGVELGTMDGLSELEHLFAEEFWQAKLQRCQVQAARNLIAKVPQKRKEEKWISLSKTNAMERVNREFKRRTKPMEVLAGERSAYTFVSFIALKTDQSWKSAPLGVKNLPFLQKFTQNCTHYRPRSSLHGQTSKAQVTTFAYLN